METLPTWMELVGAVTEKNGLEPQPMCKIRETLASNLCRLTWVNETSESSTFCIDACQSGNFARFINHSCQPNLFVQCVLRNHHDIKLARVILMAADNIPPLKELTYDYGVCSCSVMGPDGKIQQMPCYCGAAKCRKRSF